MCLGGASQGIQHDAGLNPRDATNRIDLQDPVHVLGEVENDRHVAALTGKAGPCASRQHRSAVRATHRHRGNDVVGITRNDEPDWNLTVVRTVGRVQGTAAAIEADLTANFARQCPREIG